MLEPIDIAEATLFLASDAARYVNGVIMPVDMGWRSLTRLLSRLDCSAQVVRLAR
jgi:NAD(P)-dependent dehydrogenase (short-subunit alcohol dehydrogenase family)